MNEICSFVSTLAGGTGLAAVRPGRLDRCCHQPPGRHPWRHVPRWADVMHDALTTALTLDKCETMPAQPSSRALLTPPPP
mmetsp:Transcript_32622/g.86675  ORF Transcript_32622/g.86675 Transcript_32622/m.86675 type:complete len:80 (-) Transcript_32622:2-241(-)